MSLELTKRIANSVPWLDHVAKRAQPPVQRFLGSRPGLHNLLDGKWLGVPLHPALTDVPVGAWTSAFTLDLVGVLTGSETADKAADGALAVGRYRSRRSTTALNFGDFAHARLASRARRVLRRRQPALPLATRAADAARLPTFAPQRSDRRKLPLTGKTAGLGNAKQICPR